MQEAVPVGAGTMAAILGLDPDGLEQICAQAAEGQVVSPANFNSAGQIVIAGHTEAVERAVALSKQKGAKRAMLLPVSAPFHCSLMEPAGKRLAAVLDKVVVQPLKLPVITNVDAQPNQDASQVPMLLVRQVSAPVRWEESVATMVGMGVQQFVEIGPGKILSGLVKRIARDSRIDNVEDLASLRALKP